MPLIDVNKKGGQVVPAVTASWVYYKSLFLPSLNEEICRLDEDGTIPGEPLLSVVNNRH